MNEDTSLCKVGKKLTVIKLRRSKRFKKQCIKGNNSKIPFEERTKTLEVSKLFQHISCAL